MKTAELLRVTGWDIALPPDCGLSSAQEASLCSCSALGRIRTQFVFLMEVLSLYRADQKEPDTA